MPNEAISQARSSYNYQLVNETNSPPSQAASSLNRASNTSSEFELQPMGTTRKKDIQDVDEPRTKSTAEYSIKSRLINCAKAICAVVGVGTLLGTPIAIRHLYGSGITNPGAIRENNLAQFPRAEPLINHDDWASKMFNLMNWLDRETDVATASNITRESITEFFIKLAVEDIDGHEVARDSEIQTKFPEIFNAIEQGRKDAVFYLKSFRDKCIENCDIPLPPLSEGGSGQYLKDFIGWMFEQTTNLTSSERGHATDTVYTNLLSEMNVSQADFESRDSYIGNRTLIDFLIELAENPCHANSFSRQCVQYVLMEQSAAGLDKDKAANRPLTYALNPSPLPALIESPQAPLVFTTHLANLIRYPPLLTHMMVHELIHYAGFNDPLYTGVDNNILNSNNSTVENQIRIYDKTYYEFRSNIATHLDNIPTPFQFVLEEFFDKHIGDPEMTYPEKVSELKLELLNNDILWKSFENEATDLIAMRVLTESRRNGTSPVV
jgi:hypothetical protein